MGKQAGANLSALIESTEDLIWSVDLDYRLVTYNIALQKHILATTGVRLAAGMLPTETMKAGSADFMGPLYERSLKQGPFRTELALEDGRTLELAFNQMVTDGETTGVSVFGKDITERKRTEEELRESRDSLKEAQTIGGLGSYILDVRKGGWTSSSLLDELFGIDESYEHSVEGWVALIHPDDRVMMTAYFVEEVVGQRESFDKEYRIVRQTDQAVLWVHGRGRLEFDAQGHPVTMRGVIRDITERKLATRKLEESEARFRRFFEENGSVMLIVDPSNGKIIDANRAAAEYSGLPQAQLIGRSALEMSVSQPEVAERNLQRALAGERSVLNIQIRLASGEERNVEVYTSPVEMDGKLLLYAVVHDVSERRRAEEQLRDSEERYRATFQQAAVGIIHTGMDGHILRCNARFAEMIGYAPDELRGMTFQQLTMAEDLSDSLGVLRSMLKGEIESTTWEKRYIRKDGSCTWVKLVVSIQRDAEGRALNFITVVEDINDRKSAEAQLASTQDALRASEAHYRTVFQTSLDGICISQLGDGRYIDANNAFLKLMGYEREEVLGRTSLELNFWADPEARREMARNLVEHQAFRDVETRFIRKNGELVWILISAAAMEIENIHCILSVVRDISAAKAAEERLATAQQALQASEERYRNAFQTSLDSININRVSDGCFIDCNQAFLDSLGYTREEVIGKTSIELNIWENPRDRQILVEMLRETGSCRDLEAQFRKKNGEIVWGQMSGSLIESDGVPCVLSISRDISDAKVAEDEIRTLAFFDPLTHLPNRRLVSERLRQSLAASARNKRKGALLFLDVDNFKTLNDTLGHKTGDLLLQEIAHRLTACIRESDTVARLGGDEFVVILEDLSEGPKEAAAQAKGVAQKILEAVCQIYVLAGRECLSTSSIGITLFGDRADTIDDVLQQADIAMYQAKAAGRNTLRFFAPELQAAINTRASMEEEMRHAIGTGEFQLYYQPQVQSGEVIGAEALLRWNHPVRGFLPPAEFIPLAEETGLILPLGEWVLETACRQIAAWSQWKETTHITVAVNISAKQLRQPDFVEQVLGVLERTGANPKNLDLELTESMLVDNIEDVIAKMTVLKSHGLRFSLDDFGTGYSSLSYLKRLPLDQLKIDRTFVRDMLVDVTSGAIAQTVISLSKAMGLSVLAEGVETEEQRDLLTSLGCHAFQGYLFSPPLPLHDFEMLLPETSERAVPPPSIH